MREAGILMPMFSISSKFGIGSFSSEAYEFVDFLEKSGQGFWQVLPFGPTGFGNSPYQPISAFAGNPYFISPETLIKENLLTWDDCYRFDFGDNVHKVDYGKLYNNRLQLLKIAYNNFKSLESRDKLVSHQYHEFIDFNYYWLEDFALYRTIKDLHQGKAWYQWEDNYKLRDKDTLNKIKEEYQEEIDFIYFQQFYFDKQWNTLHKYANEHAVKIIGDIPFYVALDSSDVWANPEVFLIDQEGNPEVVAGCAPDAFSATGQLWGNPIYDWKALKKNNYDWWMLRIKRNYELYDVIRFDHFYGFESYYAIPYGAKDATSGKYEKGPGMDFFEELKKNFGEVPMVAEDLGEVTPAKEKLLEDSGIPGMNVLQFAFTSWDSKYLNHRHEKNSVVYTGTHDNPTTRAWVETLSEQHVNFTRRYINSQNTDYGRFVWDMIREAYHSTANLCIIPLQDYLVKGNEARINTPGTADGNWEWRLEPNFLSQDLAHSIREMVSTYSRMPANTTDKEMLKK
ncbi:MAG: 4-alpha-glucanotransferase [Erysipelotrichaceae bacterium]|nr:4-alpha-glucanotransferase [Erysipelotrichaceae bacterium]